MSTAVNSDSKFTRSKLAKIIAGQYKVNTEVDIAQCQHAQRCFLAVAVAFLQLTEAHAADVWLGRVLAAVIMATCREHELLYPTGLRQTCFLARVRLVSTVMLHLDLSSIWLCLYFAPEARTWLVQTAKISSLIQHVLSVMLELRVFKIYHLDCQIISCSN